MAQFNLSEYETVEERLRRLYELHPDARVITENLTTLQDRQVSTWVVKAEIWLPTWTLPESAKEWIVFDAGSGWYLKATGLAFEIDGQGMAQKTAALETAETSAIGRALANMNLSGNKRTTREEMQKVQRGVTPKAPAEPSRDWLAELEKTSDIDSARQLYNEARTAKAPAAVLDKIKGKFASPSA